MTNGAQQAGIPHIPPSAHESRSPNESLALELINTETMQRGKRCDALTSPEALAQWWAKVYMDAPLPGATAETEEPIAWTVQQLAAVRSLRKTLRTLALQVVERQAVQAEDLQPLNAILRLGYVALERSYEGQVKAVSHLLDQRKGSILLPIALSAVELLTQTDWRRLHQCTSDRCIVFFYDTTKSGTRRWCSPGCMNRARSIQHYHQTKAGANPTDAGS